MYEIDKEFDNEDKKLNIKVKKIIHTAIDLLEDILGHCINFEEKDHGNRVKVIKREDGCSASSGYKGRKQYVKLAPKCYFKKSERKVIYGKIQHEFLHSIGLLHEQTCK